MKKILKQKKGITLIALVITIIVLLILAGISISMLSGDNSILQKAATAKENTNSSQIQERINLAYHSALTSGLGKIDEATLKDEIKKEFNKTDSELTEENWLDKTSVTGKWRITIDEVSLEVPAGTAVSTATNESNTILTALKDVNYWDDVMKNSTITISGTDTAQFYDEDWNGYGYIEYKGIIYKIAHSTSDDGTISGVEITDIDVSTLGLSESNITTIVHGTVSCVSTTLTGESVCRFSAYGWDWYYSSEGIFFSRVFQTD